MVTDPQTWIVAGTALLAGAAGASAGIGGAVLLVPVLVLAGFPPTLAAALGLLTVAAASTAAAPRQLRQHLVNHRLAVSIETTAGAGAVIGAVLAAAVSRDVFVAVLAAAVIVAAAGGLRRHPAPNPRTSAPAGGRVGEQPGTLAGAYRLGSAVVGYRARRAPLGLTLAGAVGVVAGLTGTSGGYLKTPLMSDVMDVPVKVAAATTTLASGITSVAALLVYAVRGDVDPRLGAAALVGALAGGALGARAQELISPRLARVVLSALLLAIAVLLVTVR